MRFVGRKRELAFLDTQWRKPGAQLIIVTGKRRVGKTALLSRWIQRKPAVYYLADRRPEREQLRELAKRLGTHLDDPFVASKGFDDWLEVFAYLKTKVRRRFALVIDEYPYLAANNPATSSLFQKGWDETLQALPITLVLCGSSIAMMVSETLAQKAPLYGRRTGDLLVRPLEFEDVCRFLPRRLAFEECAAVYATLGGMPGYLAQLDMIGADLEANIRAQILTPGTLLFREVDYLLSEELREPRNYLAILAAIAQGKRKFGEIVNATKLPPTAPKTYLDVLEQLQLVEREVPITEAMPHKSKKSLYGLQDAFVALWFELVYPYRSELELENPRPSLDRLRKVLPGFLSRAYERIAREMVRKARDLPFPLHQVGRWWDSADEIDVVGLNPEVNGVLFGEAKWSGQAVGVNVLDALKAKAGRVNWGRPERREAWALFSRSGFTADLRHRAKSEGVVLFHGIRRLT
jgi:AAA+ ATPase superfamily predicted ATPase